MLGHLELFCSVFFNYRNIKLILFNPGGKDERCKDACLIFEIATRHAGSAGLPYLAWRPPAPTRTASPPVKVLIKYLYCVSAVCQLPLPLTSTLSLDVHIPNIPSPLRVISWNFAPFPSVLPFVSSASALTHLFQSCPSFLFFSSSFLLVMTISSALN